jgi:hypothetical protein
MQALFGLETGSIEMSIDRAEVTRIMDHGIMADGAVM